MSKRKWKLLSVVLVVAFFALSGVIQDRHVDVRARESVVGRDQGARSRLSGRQAQMSRGLADFSERIWWCGVGPRFNFESVGADQQPVGHESA